MESGANKKNNGAASMIRVLIVEDDDNKINEIERVIESNGVRKPSYTSINNIQDALSALRETKFDILILDLQLPQRSNSKPTENGGVGLLYKLSSNKFITPTYIIGLTQYPELLGKYENDFRRIDFNVFNFNETEWLDALKHKLKWIIASQRCHLERRPDKNIYILTHGIMTSGKWQDDVESKIKHGKDDIKVVKYSYPYYSALHIIFPFLHRKAVKNYNTFLENIIIQHPSATINFISHSFGTYLTINALNSGEFEKNTKIGKIILCGSVLKRDYDMAAFIEKCQPNIIINDCGTNDVPLILCNTFVWGLGDAGRNGFDGYCHLLKNRFFNGGHSYFFSDDTFYNKYWKPLIIEDQLIENDSRKKQASMIFYSHSLAFFHKQSL
ncbi:response regulator [Plesiomonas shigelloides]|uniref:response regulator n=1 Tax=Plesiomonas shigelloides TaxID=703 RepID=UPI0012629101|nr:response regulator [Plesiomonas shigelloides]KAB7669748.1 response regulator [Plesiomonas shigelloides]